MGPKILKENPHLLCPLNVELSFISCFWVLTAGVLSVCVELPWLNLEKLGVEKLLSLMGGGQKFQPEKSIIENQATNNKIVGEEAGKSN